MHPRIVAERTLKAQRSAAESASRLAELLGVGEEQAEALKLAMSGNKPELKVLRISEAVAGLLAVVAEMLEPFEEGEAAKSSFLDFLADDVRSELFSRYDNPDALREATVEELTGIKGIGPSKAAKIVESVREALEGSDG